ncbi:single-stranded DNA-binding protein [Microbispora sp. H11081]|uniref:single-stranded DNA-binding protein n=1 Tax=Microbispora sp. H11081 TaxID=2729107 RepID=UPI0014735930|nr:single-stranded DNA-binding protein [Microbispora sp. H11081]
MNDIYVTLSGNVTDDPRQYQFRDGSRVTSMRMAVNRRVLDQQTNTWQTRDTTYYTVRCYRGLADNVQQSIRRGHPVVVYGKLRIKQFEREGEQRFWAEIEATSVGHDLKWGIATFEKPIRAYSAGAPSDGERRAMEDATREWELTGPTALGGGIAEDGGGDEAFDALVGGRGADGEAAQAAGARESAGVRETWPAGDTGPAAQPGETGLGDAQEATDAATALGDAAAPRDASDTGDASDPEAEGGDSQGGEDAWLTRAVAA